MDLLKQTENLEYYLKRNISVIHSQPVKHYLNWGY